MSPVAITADNPVSLKCPKCGGKSMLFEACATVRVEDGGFARAQPDNWTAWSDAHAVCDNVECEHSGQIREFLTHA